MAKPGLLKEHAPGLAIVHRLVDAVVVYGCGYLPAVLYNPVWLDEYTLAFVTAVACYHLVAEFNGLYRTWGGARIGVEIRQALVNWGIVVAILLLLAFGTQKSEAYSRVASTIWFVTTPVALALWRVAYHKVLGRVLAEGRAAHSVAVAGCTQIAERLLASISADPALGMTVHGVYDDRSASRRHPLPEQLGKVIGTLDDLVEDARQGTIDHVFVTLPMRAEARAANIIRRLADTTATVLYVPDFDVFDLLHARWTFLGDVPVISVFDTPFQGLGGWVKRAEDLLLSIVGLVLLAVPMVAIAIAVKVSSPGPVLFRQRRYGLSGRQIYVWKYRTMTVCEDDAQVTQAKRGDQRVTRLGAWLRRTSLDELPQLFNVMEGTMSLVGPRPHAVAHNELYRSQIHGYMLRHKVKPGITGWAQVNGWRGETDTLQKMEKRIEHDLYYIHHWGIGLDLKILFLTVFGRRVRQNAY